jgi:hypothetical protein
MAWQELYINVRHVSHAQLERLYIDNCLRLTVELFHQLAIFILSCKPISYCRFKRIDVYIL